MATAYEEILKILAEVEAENGVPAGTMKDVYLTEKSQVHMLSRGSIHDHLHGIVSGAAKKAG